MTLPSIPIAPRFTRRAPIAFVAVVALMELAAFARPAHAAPSLETFVLSAGGVSDGPLGGCTTFAPPPPVAAYFGGGLGLPLDGLAACGVAGGFRDATAAGGPISDLYSLNASWPAGSFSGATATSAAYGTLAAEAHAVFNGSTSSTTVTGSEAFGRCNDSFTITSPSVANGQSGTVRFLVTVTGGLSTTVGNGTADVELNYQIGGPVFTMFRAQSYQSTSVPFITSISGAGLSGFTATTGAVSGSGQTTTFAHSITFGTPFDFNLGLFTYAVPGNSSNPDAHFQATITGIEVTGPGGQVLADFAAVAASGASYGSGGVTAVEDSAPDANRDAVRLAASPNPASSRVRLTFVVPRSARAQLVVFDAAGRVVRRLLDEPDVAAGRHDLTWDGRDDHGVRLAHGTYYARLCSNGEASSTRITLVD